MFVDWNERPVPPPWQPPRRKRKRDETILMSIIGVNLVLLLVAPIAGASVLHALAAVLGY